MAKNNKRKSKQGWFSKGINIGLWVLAFSRVLEHAFSGSDFTTVIRAIKRDATFGLSEGGFDLNQGLSMYTPGAAAVGLNELKKYAQRHFPVR